MASGARPGSLVPPKVNGTAIPGRAPDDTRIESSCARVNTDYQIAVASIYSICIIIGLLYTFFGYRCFKTIMFLTGFIFASGIVFMICRQGELMPSYGNAGVSLLAGILFGLITMLVQYVGLFMTGLHTGLLLALASLLTADHLVETSPKGSIWLGVAVILCTSLTFAIFNLYFRKGLTILGSCLYGGALLSVAVDYFVEKSSIIEWVRERVFLKPVQPPPCWFSWIILGAWPAFVLVGLITQFGITGRGIHHADVVAGRKKPRAPCPRGITRADRAEMRQKKYRYLYQVRTAHGDVISQNFVQQLQRKDIPDIGQGECSTLQSDATHLTILPDAQLAVLTESEDDSQTEIRPRR